MVSRHSLSRVTRPDGDGLRRCAESGYSLHARPHSSCSSGVVCPWTAHRAAKCGVYPDPSHCRDRVCRPAVQHYPHRGAHVSLACGVRCEVQPYGNNVLKRRPTSDVSRIFLSVELLLTIPNTDSCNDSDADERVGEQNNRAVLGSVR